MALPDVSSERKHEEAIVRVKINLLKLKPDNRFYAQVAMASMILETDPCCHPVSIDHLREPEELLELMNPILMRRAEVLVEKLLPESHRRRSN